MQAKKITCIFLRTNLNIDGKWEGIYIARRLVEVLLAHEYNTCGRRMDKPEVIHSGLMCRSHRLNLQTEKQDKCN